MLHGTRLQQQLASNNNKKTKHDWTTRHKTASIHILILLLSPFAFAAAYLPFNACSQQTTCDFDNQMVCATAIRLYANMPHLLVNVQMNNIIRWNMWLLVMLFLLYEHTTSIKKTSPRHMSQSVVRSSSSLSPSWSQLSMATEMLRKTLSTPQITNRSKQSKCNDVNAR